MKIDRSKFLGFCFSMVPVVAVACGGGGNDGTNAGGSDLSGSGGQQPASGTDGGTSSSQPAAAAAAAAAVTVNTTPESDINTDQCEVDIKAPTVSIPTNKAAETAINTVLAPISASPCAEGRAAVESTFEVTANANGLLSIRVTGESFFTNAAHPNGIVQTFNFDVKNGGKQLQLADVVTAAGMAKEVATCGTTVTNLNADPSADAGLGSPVDEGAQMDCTISLTPDPTLNISPGWVATKDGLEVEADVAHAKGDFAASTVAWKDLVTGGLNATVVLDFAKAQP